MTSVATGCSICVSGEGRHRECGRCHILIGPGHKEVGGKWIGGKYLCSDCQRRIGQVHPPLVRVKVSLESLYEHWRAGATAQDLVRAKMVESGVLKVRRRRSWIA